MRKKLSKKTIKWRKAQKLIELLAEEQKQHYGPQTPLPSGIPVFTNDKQNIEDVNEKLAEELETLSENISQLFPILKHNQVSKEARRQWRKENKK